METKQPSMTVVAAADAIRRNAVKKLRPEHVTIDGMDAAGITFKLRIPLADLFRELAAGDPCLSKIEVMPGGATGAPEPPPADPGPSPDKPRGGRKT